MLILPDSQMKTSSNDLSYPIHLEQSNDFISQKLTKVQSSFSLSQPFPVLNWDYRNVLHKTVPAC